MRKFLFLFVFSLLAFPSCKAAAVPRPDPPREKSYEVRCLKEHGIKIDGILSPKEWPEKSWLSDFAYPWRKEEPPRTRFCYVTDGKFIFFAFECRDQDLVLHGKTPPREEKVAEGDRVEIFFSRDTSLKEYWCVEIGPTGRVLDYKASFYRKFDDSWDLPGLEVEGRTCRKGYVVEGKFPVSALENLTGVSLLEGRAVLAGVFRAEFSHSESSLVEEKWISWIRPACGKPDFHIPSAFGVFRIQKARKRGESKKDQKYSAPPPTSISP